MKVESGVAAVPAVRWLPVVQVLCGSAVLAASARIATPFMTVPTTLQTYALLVLAVVFGPRLAAASAVTYLVEGLAGLPVFAAGAGGPLVFVGPTAGYLIAFPFVAFLVGRLYPVATRRFPLLGAVLLMVGAHATIIASGVAWLTSSVGFSTALAVGAVPFVAGTLVKSVLAAVTARLLRS